MTFYNEFVSSNARHSSGNVAQFSHPENYLLDTSHVWSSPMGTYDHQGMTGLSTYAPTHYSSFNSGSVFEPSRANMQHQGMDRAADFDYDSDFIAATAGWMIRDSDVSRVGSENAHPFQPMDVLHVPQDSVNQPLTEIPSSFQKDNKITIVEDLQVMGSYPSLQQLEGPHFAGFSNLPALFASSHHPSEVSPVGSSPDAYPAVSLSLSTLTTPPITGTSSSRQTKVILKAPKGKKSKRPAQRKCTRTKCPRCPRTFPCPADMRRHRLSDHDNVRFQCPHSSCPNRKYTRYDALLRHDTSKHLGVGRPVEIRSPGGPKASPGPKRKEYAHLRAKRDARAVEKDEVVVEKDVGAANRAERAERRAANRAFEM